MDSILFGIGKAVCTAARGIGFESFFVRQCMKNITGSALDPFYLPNYLNVGQYAVGILVGGLVLLFLFGRGDKAPS